MLQRGFVIDLVLQLLLEKLEPRLVFVDDLPQVLMPTDTLSFEEITPLSSIR